MDPKENFCRAITYDNPAYVPYPDEGFRVGVQFDGNFRHANWTDGWGVGWRVTLEEFVPFPKVNPLPSLDRLEDYRIPDPDALAIGEEMRAILSRPDRGRLFVTGSAHLPALRARLGADGHGGMPDRLSHPPAGDARAPGTHRRL